jgi:hypothetical protein
VGLFRIPGTDGRCAKVVSTATAKTDLESLFNRITPPEDDAVEQDSESSWNREKQGSPEKQNSRHRTKYPGSNF